MAYAIDRLSRDPVHLGVILSEAEHQGVQVECVTEPLDDTPEGQLLRYIRGYAAKVELEKIRERNLRGKHACVRNGKIHGHGIERYGYRRDKELDDHGKLVKNGKRSPYEPEAVSVHQIFQWYAEEKRNAGLRSWTNNRQSLCTLFGKVPMRAILLELIRREVAKIEQEKAQLRSTLSCIEEQLTAAQIERERLDSLQAYCEQVGKNLQAFTFEEKCKALDVRFINTLPVLMASRHSRESGNPGGEGHGDWMPAYAGMTFYWYRTCEMDI